MARYVVDLCRHMTMLDVAEHLEMSWDTVKKGLLYLTVVLDLESGAVVFVGNGKGAEAFPPFLKRMRGSWSRIEAVAVDMSPFYTAAVLQNLPQAVLVYDVLHVIQLFNHNLSQLRRELYSQSKDKTERWMLKGVRWLLFKIPENLNEENGEKARLEEALRFNQPLATVYYLKESLR